MDVVAGEGMPLPGVRLWNQPVQVMPNQKKVKARRKRREELVLIQICLFGGLLLVVKGFSGFSGNSGERLVGSGFWGHPDRTCWDGFSLVNSCVVCRYEFHFITLFMVNLNTNITGNLIFWVFL